MAVDTIPGLGRYGYELSAHSGPGGDEWDAFVAQAAGGHHVQTSRWAQVKEAVGWRGVRVLTRRDGELVGGCQLLIRKLPIGGSLAYGPHGPLLPSASEDALNALLAGLREVTRQHRVRYLKLQPPIGREDIGSALDTRGFVRSELSAGPSATVQVNLEPVPERLLREMRRGHRNRIHRAEKAGVVVRQGGETDLPVVRSLIEATSRRRGFAAFPLDYYARMWRSFIADGHGTVLVAEHQETALGALVVIAWGETVTAKVSGATREGGDIFSEAVLDWAGMRWAQERGYRLYDLDGIDEATARSLIAGAQVPPAARPGVTHYKLGLGGDVVISPQARDRAYGKVLGPVLVRAVQSLQRTGARKIANRLLGRR